MGNRRLFLYLALGLICFALWSAWEKDNAAKPSTSTPATTEANTNTSSNTSTNEAAAQIAQKLQPVPETQLIHVTTDTLAVDINTNGGNIVNAKLLKYPLSLKEKDTPVQILNSTPEKLYIAESGITGAPVQYQAQQKNYVLDENAKSLTVLLHGNAKGIAVTKTYTFTNKYDIAVDLKITNQSSKSWTGEIYNQITQKKPEEKHGFFTFSTYTGPTISSPEKPYEKLSYSKLDGNNLNRDIKGGWLAVQQRYFLSVWIPDQNSIHNFYSAVANGDIYTVGYKSAISLPANSTKEISNKFYVGPEIKENLAALAKNLDLTIDYGWLWIISVVLFWLMQQIYNIIGNWGWSIILVTVIIKLIFFKFSESSYKSMAKMRALAPKLKELKERYGSDRQKMSQETMKLYQKEKVNPIGGCLPMLIQIPVFIALYYVIIEAVQLRQAPFMLWIQDLSVQDPYYILPVIMGISMFVQQKLNPAPPDPMQAKMFMLMPIFFTFLFAAFPSGLVLYWTANNLLSLLQQWYIMRRYERTHSR
jgi:YidC/Oxa1 family membrane protein insertase